MTVLHLHVRDLLFTVLVCAVIAGIVLLNLIFSRVYDIIFAENRRSVMKHLLHLSYLGTNYCGFQVQPNGNTVQAELQKAATRLFYTACGITGCSRTDSGVHALEYAAVLGGAWHVGHPRGIGAARAEYLSSAGYLGASQ